jgi:hypothetical protein
MMLDSKITLVQGSLAGTRRRTSDLDMQLRIASDCGVAVKVFEIRKALDQARQIVDALEQCERTLNQPSPMSIRAAFQATVEVVAADILTMKEDEAHCEDTVIYRDDIAEYLSTHGSESVSLWYFGLPVEDRDAALDEVGVPKSWV